MEINCTPQDLVLELMRLASFNEYDGECVVRDLISHRELWKGAYMTRDDFIQLRDLPDGHYNVDTLYITVVEGREEELELLAKSWRADEVDWIGGQESQEMLGYGNRSKLRECEILRIWWD